MNTPDIQVPDPLELFPERVDPIMLCYRGSVAHGTYVPPEDPSSIDDIDLMGVWVDCPAAYLGFGRKDVAEKWIGQFDFAGYELRKLFSLLLKANPNVLSLLFLPFDLVIHTSNTWIRIIANRNLFLSKLAYKSYTGYAYSQLKRMTRHEHRGYMGEKRKALVAEHGYDTKNASHLIRLLRQAIEFFDTHKIVVVRPDAQELIDIKSGKYSLEEVQDMSEILFRQAEEAKDKSTLPDYPAKHAAERLLVDILRQTLPTDTTLYA